MQSNLFIFAGGGTGGHLYPGLAVAAELVKLRPQAKIVFACSNRAIDRRILDREPYAIVPQPVKPIPGSVTGWIDFARAFMASAAQAKTMVADLQPEAVLGLGGFAAGPVVRAAAKAGIPSALLNPDAVPGKANKMLCHYVQAIFTQFDRTITHFPASARQKVNPFGCPIRSSLLSANREQAISALGLRPGLSTLLVLGGSLGAASINEAIVRLLADMAGMADTWQLLHITGPDKSGDMAGALAKAPLPVVSMEYCQQMELAYAAADLVLCRSGASTVAELSALALPSVLLPYPYHRDQQQKLNAAGLASAGAAVICEDAKNPSDNAQRLRHCLLPLMKDAAQLQKMRQAAAAIGKPNAAMDIAMWLDGDHSLTA